ncbi:MAG: hypothetical protein GFH27_549283n252 [Chloroflexi bacterium AL-W]|nr:hypothetical protein [Chloroflexi bacterium AL-N1]NOK64628.1 hypothetical protein [Chloroflexi bacterium AL-N10]NOK75869.1 hypothetical protein [Chloroflexi bacterium AL-N5]NOK80373.1 hypothetical protein [Chloroflexi bacterium AL-W]NOK86886.1 hypothetical protein [Chloroflexi bacterium AL-N15]
MKRRTKWLARLAGVMAFMCVLASVDVQATFAQTNDVPLDTAQPTQVYLLPDGTEVELTSEDIEFINALIQELQRSDSEFLAALSSGVQPDDVSIRNCAAAIAAALLANLVGINRVRAAIRALGGVTRFVRVLSDEFFLARRLGLSRNDAIRAALQQVGRQAGFSQDDIFTFIAEFLLLNDVINNCFPSDNHSMMKSYTRQAVDIPTNHRIWLNKFQYTSL